MTTPEFDGARLKILRASQNFDEFNRIEDAYLAANPYELFVDESPEGRAGWRLLKIRAKYPPPEIARTVLADIIGGLRSSLDLAVAAATRVAGQHNPKHTAFCITETPEKWENSIRSQARAVPPSTVAAMRNAKPWREGNLPLYALGELANADKHRLLTPMALMTAGTGFDFIKNLGPGPARVSAPIRPEWDSGRDEGTLAYISPGSNVEIGAPHISAFFAFGTIPYSEGLNIRTCVAKLLDLTTGIVGDIERTADVVPAQSRNSL